MLVGIINKSTEPEGHAFPVTSLESVACLVIGAELAGKS